jgi:hypothetical protein
MISEAAEAVNVCGDISSLFTNPALVALGKLAMSCPVSDQMWDRGNANFDYYVKTLGVKQACAAFIAGIKLTPGAASSGSSVFNSLCSSVSCLLASATRRAT